MSETHDLNDETAHVEAPNESRESFGIVQAMRQPDEQLQGPAPTFEGPSLNQEGDQPVSVPATGRHSDDAIENLVDLFRDFLEAAPSRAPSNSTHPATQRRTTRRSRVFGLQGLSYEIVSNNKYAYEQKYTQDRYGEETSENARIWLTYLDEAEPFDRERVEEWKAAADVLLVFAGLFSAVITSFIGQASPRLQRDNTQISASLLFEIAGILRAQSDGTPLNTIPISTSTLTSPFTPSTNVLLVNGLWFTSLAVTLSTALLAAIAKQWPRYSLSSIPGTAKERARARQLRFKGFEVWKVGAILDLLPILLYVAVGLFLAGIIIMLFPLDVTIAWTIVGITGITYTLYFISVILPIRYPECPYTTSLTIYVGILFLAMRKALCGINAILNERLCIIWGKMNPVIRRTIRNLAYYALSPFRLAYMLILALFDIMLRAFQRLGQSVSELAKWREVKIKYAIKTAASLDSEALDWLYATSWNRSVHRMIARCAAVNQIIGIQFKDDILEDLSRTLEISETNLVDLRYALCLDVLSSHWGRRDDRNDRVSLDNRDNWALLLSKPDVIKDQLEEGEYQSYLRLARTSSGVHGGVQVLHNAISDEDGLSLPLVMWGHLFEEAIVDDATVVDMAVVDTVAVEIITHGNKNLFDWKFDPTREPIHNAGLVCFNGEELGWWKFRYLLRWLHRFDDGRGGWKTATLRFLLHYFKHQRDEARPYEKCYIILITIYGNLTSDHPLISDKEQRQQSLKKLFASFSDRFQLSHRSYTLEEGLCFFREICCVDSFWCESMTDDSQ